MPLFLWFGEAVTAGDATGGNLVVGITFKAGLLYSVEGVSCGQEGGVLTDDTLRLITQDGGLIMVIGFRKSSTVIEAPSPVLHPLNWPIFRPDGLADASLDHARGNDPAITALRLHAWGYAWDLEASRAPEGPLRPG